MALINKTFPSASRKQKWVDHISKKFTREITIDISDENPICVFKVPNSITIFDREAYLPQVIALGPHHHLNPHFYQMERYKLASAKSFFNKYHHGNLAFRQLLINKLKQLDPIVRGCYHSYIELDDETLSWILAIDGLFLLDLLRYYIDDLKDRKMACDALLSRDLLLLENQIPFVVLKEIYKILEYNSSENNAQVEGELLLMMEGFCRAQSPLNLATKISSHSFHGTSHWHLLDLMYHLIVINNGESDDELALQEEGEDKDESEEGEVVEEAENTDVIGDNIDQILEVGMKFMIGRKILKPLEVIREIPWDKIWSMLGIKTVANNNNPDAPMVEEIKIPSVSSLHHYAGITFRPTNGGIRDIKFVEEEATLYLPTITLDVNSEVVLRNLVAYEIATNYSQPTLPFSQFVDLMSGIVDTFEDAKLLKESGIIKGKLTNEQIVDLFNGMNKSSGNTCNKTVEKINKYYKSRPIVRIYRFAKKNAYISWKAITLVSSVLLLMLLVLYSFCEFYGCPKFFGSSS